MIDIHSHVLYGLDDGAATLDDSVAMLQMAAASGTTDLVATPHANLQYRFDPHRIEERLAELAAAVPAVHLYSGCDFHLSFENIQDAIANPSKYTINHQGYLLVEFSDLIIFRNTPEILARLQDAGMIPIVTHPERNGLLRQRLDQMEKWVESGARVQITGQSLLGRFGRRAQEFSETLLDRRLAHFVASDAHDCEHRPPKLDVAFAAIEKRHGLAFAEELCIANPRAAIDGNPIAATQAAVRSGDKKWYQVWR